MILSIARQSVVIKCELQKSVMTGNYEFYYASGLLSRLTGKPIETGTDPQELKKAVMAILETYDPEDPREKHLAQMLKYYDPEEEKNAQMDQLFEAGQNESNFWQEKGVAL